MPRARKAAPVAPEGDSEAPAAVTASGIQMIELSRLRRAPENVRHTNKDVDVESLSDDIAAHGLLQNLIGYAGDTAIDKAVVYIVGGGRRLQALQRLLDLATVPEDFPVPVLLRPAAEAIDLSLSENLAKRDMNPADEFLAFQALMRRGTVSAANLAKQFGFSERYVKQRLKLASLAEEILDALRAGEMTLEAAMAYGRAADQDVQRAVFKAQAKRNFDKHSPHKIRYDIDVATKTTEWSLYRYVGADAYEREGGGYEEAGLFDESNGGARRLTSAFAVVHRAHQHIDFQMIMRLRQMAEEIDLDPAQVTGFVKVKDLVWGTYSMAYHGLDKQAPDGFAWVGNDYGTDRVERMLKTIRNNRILCQLPVGVNDAGELIRIPKGFFVPKDQVRAVDAPAHSPVSAGPTAEEQAAAERARKVRAFAAMLVADENARNKVEGRRFWPHYIWEGNRILPGLGEVVLLKQQVAVTEAEIAAKMDEAAVELDRHEAEVAAEREAQARAQEEAEAAEAAKRAELVALDPAPVALRIGELDLFRWADGSWYDEREVEDADPVYQFDDLSEVAEWAEEEGARIVQWWFDLTTFDAGPDGDPAHALEEQAA